MRRVLCLLTGALMKILKKIINKLLNMSARYSLPTQWFCILKQPCVIFPEKFLNCFIILGLLSIYSNVAIKNDSVKWKFQFKLVLGESNKWNFVLRVSNLNRHLGSLDKNYLENYLYLKKYLEYQIFKSKIK